MSASSWPVADLIETPRLLLEPLRVEHAEEMGRVLSDESLHGYIGGHPPTVEQIRARYVRQVAGLSADRKQGWLNWVVRARETGAAIGSVQATLHEEDRPRAAEIAWVITPAHQQRGYAKEAARAMVRWLRQNAANAFIAHIHPDHQASISVARHLGLKPTGVMIDGEARWTS